MPICRKCNMELVVGKTWWPSCAKNNRRVCIECRKAYAQKRRAEAEITEAKCQGATCRKCGTELVVGTNWHTSCARYNNRICIECKHQYYIEHRERENRRNRQYYAERREEINEHHRQYAAEHRQEARGRMQRWRKKNPEKAREKCRRRYAYLAGATIEGVDEVTIYERCGNRCIYCGSKENLTLDHIVSINAGGPHCEDNLVVACQSCNSRKHTKPLIEWLRTQPYSQAWVI